MEVIRLLLENQEQFDEIVRKGFITVDADGSGKIDKGELGAAMKEISICLDIPVPSAEEMNRAFIELDKDKSGEIDYDEFNAFVRVLFDAMKEGEE